MIRNHVIFTDKGYISYASILSIEGEVSINRVTYSDNLQEAQVFNENDYIDDKKAWEEFSSKELFFNFQYLEVIFEVKGVIA